MAAHNLIGYLINVAKNAVEFKHKLKTVFFDFGLMPYLHFGIRIMVYNSQHTILHTATTVACMTITTTTTTTTR